MKFIFFSLISLFTFTNVHASEIKPLEKIPPLDPEKSLIDSHEKRIPPLIMGRSHLQYLKEHKVVRRKSAGGIYTVPAGPAGTKLEDLYLRLMITDPHLARKFLKKFPNKAPLPILDIFLKDGLLTEEEVESWRQRRKWLKPPLRLEAVKNHLSLVQQATTELLIKDLFKESIEPIDIHAKLHKITFTLIGNTMLGEESTWLQDNVDSLRQAFDLGLQPNYLKTTEGQKAEQIMREFSLTTFDRAEQRRKKNQQLSNHETIIDRLKSTDENSPYLNNPNLHHKELMTFMFAGHETTANTLSWLFYELGRNLESQTLLREAINNVLNGKLPEQITFEDLNKIELLRASILEALRLWPVVANGSFRKTGEQEQIITSNDGQQYKLPPHTPFQAPHIVFHRNKEIWGDNADQYDLTRPLKGPSSWHYDDFMPFGRPPRDCIGRHFAMMEMSVITLSVIYYFELEYIGEEKKGQNWATLAPEEGVLLQLTPVKRLSKL